MPKVFQYHLSCKHSSFLSKIDGVVVSSGKKRINEDVVVYNQILKNIAAEDSLGYIDFYSAFTDDKEILLSADGVHPNEKGYGMMAEIAIQSLKSICNA